MGHLAEQEKYAEKCWASITSRVQRRGRQDLKFGQEMGILIIRAGEVISFCLYLFYCTTRLGEQEPSTAILHFKY